MYGYGYPLFEFNYHLPWYAATPLIFLKVNLFDIIKILHFVSYFLSGIFMYVFLKEIVKNKFFSFLGAFLFMVSPYRFVNIYVRNAIGEVFAMMFFPLVFYFFIKLAKNLKYSSAICFAAAVTGIILSHAISFLLFLPSLLVFGLYCLSQTKNKKKFIWLCVFSGILFVGLSAYYLLPAYLEKSYTIFDSKFQQIYGRELLDFKRIIYSFWGYSGNGNLPENVMSFQFGIPNWVLTALAGIVFIFLMLTKKVKETKLIALSLFMIGFSIFLCIKPSLFLWNMFAKIFAVDFPWKFIGIAIFWSGILFSLIMVQIISRFKYLIAFVFIILILYANRNHIRVNKYVSFDIPSATFYEKTTNTEDEYMPKWMSADYFKNETNMRLKNEERIILSGSKKYAISRVADSTNKFSYTYSGDKSNQIVKKIYFPGWQVFVNEQEVKFNFNNGFFNFAVPKGKSSILIKYSGTPLVKTTDLISLLSWVAIIVYLLYIFFCEVRVARFSPQDKN